MRYPIQYKSGKVYNNMVNISLRVETHSFNDLRQVSGDSDPRHIEGRFERRPGARH